MLIDKSTEITINSKQLMLHDKNNFRGPITKKQNASEVYRQSCFLLRMFLKISRQSQSKSLWYLACPRNARVRVSHRYVDKPYYEFVLLD